MEKINKILIIALFLLISSAFLSTAKAGEDDNYCYLEASVDVRVEVWNLDDEGNKGYLIWKGLIKQGDRKQIRAVDGRIRYASTRYVNENEPLEGDIDRWCSDGQSIGVP